MAKFSQYCCESGSDGPVVARGDEEDEVLVGYKDKGEALRALRAVGEDQDFPEIRVAPVSQV